jgi:hypothetical protein
MNDSSLPFSRQAQPRFEDGGEARTSRECSSAWPYLLVKVLRFYALCRLRADGVLETESSDGSELSLFPLLSPSDAKSMSTFRDMPMQFAIFLARDGAVVTSYSACASAPVKGSRRWNPAVGQKSPRLPQGSTQATASLPAEKRGKSADRNSPAGNVTRSERRRCAKRGWN